jgi:type II secretory pathway predicted ATPase ExeA
MRLEPPTVPELVAYLRHVLDKAGNAQLLTDGAINALAEHAAGNCRTMMGLGNDLLHAAVSGDVRQIDEKLFFRVFAMTPPAKPDTAKRRR